MCTLRALFVISEGGDIVLSRRYGSVERLAKQVYGDQYVPVAPDWEFKQLFLDEFAKEATSSTPKPNAFEAVRAQAIFTLQEKLWPVVYLNTIGLFLVAVPLIEGVIQHVPTQSSQFQSIDFYQQLPLGDVPFVTTTLAFLDVLVQFVEPCAPRFELDKIAELQTLLSRMVQFGRPIESNYQNVVALNKTDFPATDTSDPRPSWKPVVSAIPRVPPRVEFQLIETISAVQYDHPKLVSDTWQVQGKMVSRVDLDVNVAITVPISKTPGSVGEVQDARYHSCVTSPPWTTSPLLTTFQPPLGQISLANWSVSVPRLPIRGFYQLRDTAVANVYKVLVQLKLSDFVNNNFDFFDVELPFPTRKEILSFDLVPGAGQVAMHPKKKNTLIWSLGTRFVGRNMEVAMPGSITFDPTVIIEGSEDPFCVLPNAYIDIRFRIPDTSLAGLNLDTRQVTINPKPSGLKGISFERHLASDKYIIWNSGGNVKYCSSPEAPSSST